MATIPLRVYNRDIETLIEAGKLDQAISHCKHILKTHSMHIETYQLLGKAYLEAHRYADATDIFLRILNAVPDDFISHVGVSIIRDDEGKLNESIWHMERAYEVQPSNPAIQGELRRLYGKRDGMEPAKIRLSREALANMYAQGELYTQAIAEIRAILTEDPDRPDLQVMLARAYFHTDQKMEAAEMASHLLKKYPYCVDALRVLVQVLPDTTKTENIHVYRQRLKLLDPYSPFVTESVFHTDQVADDAVELEKLDYLPDTQANLGQAAWASSLGIKLDDLRNQEATDPGKISPDTSAEQVTEPSVEIPQSENEPAAEQPQNAAQDESLEKSEISSGTTEDTSGGLVKAEIPDWLKSQVPPNLPQAETIETANTPEETDLPGWLTSLSEVDTQPSSTIGIQPQDSLTNISLSSEVPDLPISNGTSIQESQPPESQEPEEKNPKDETDGMESWLEKLAGGSITASTTNAVQNEEQIVGEKGNEDDEQPVDSFAPSDQEIVETGISNEVDDFASKTEEMMGDGRDDSAIIPIIDEKEEIITTEKAEDLPEWINALAQGPEASSSSSNQGVDLDSADTKETTSGVDNGGDQQVESTAKIPDWLRVIEEENAFETEISTTEASGINTPLEAENPVPIPDNDSQKKQEDDFQEKTNRISSETPEEDKNITTWLKKLDKQSGIQPSTTPEEDIITNREEDLPEWLRDLEKDKSAREPISEVEKSVGGTEIPDWISQRLEPLPDAPTQVNDLPSKEAESSEDEQVQQKQAVPTIPTEWIPEQRHEPNLSTDNHVSGESPLISGSDISARMETIEDLKTETADQPGMDKDNFILSTTRDLIRTDHLKEATSEFQKLIKRGKNLDEIIEELHKANELYPDNIQLWQTLGDAYMRSNRLQNALDAYSKAEELLR